MEPPEVLKTLFDAGRPVVQKQNLRAVTVTKDNVRALLDVFNRKHRNLFEIKGSNCLCYASVSFPSVDFNAEVNEGDVLIVDRSGDIIDIVKKHNFDQNYLYV
jgi:hypothetical protein